MGRKAWLFADSAQGAKASATCYSLLETAKANDLEPSAYINYVLAQIGEADSLEKLEALLPWNVPLEPIAKKWRNIPYWWIIFAALSGRFYRPCPPITLHHFY